MKALTTLFFFLSFLPALTRAQIICIKCYQQNDSISSGVNNLLMNGGFENSNCNPWPGNGRFCPSSTAYNCNIANWTCTGGGTSTYACMFDATSCVVAEGNRTAYFGNNYSRTCSTVQSDTSCLITTGCTTSGPPAGYPTHGTQYGGSTGVSLQQTVNGLVSGNVYILEFWAGGEWGYLNRGLFAVDIGFGNTMLRCKATPIAGGVGTVYIIEWRATAASHTVKFTNWGHACNNCSELVLDNVRLYTLAELSATVPSCSAPFSVSINPATGTCGPCNSTATAIAQGGTAPLSYIWSTGQNTQAIGSLCTGLYRVTVTDGGNATATASVTITQPVAVTANPSSAAASCGNSNGNASVTASGGNGSFTYLWSNGDTTATAVNLATGSYTVTVTSGVCSDTASVAVNSLGSAVVLFPSSVGASCGNSNGSADANVTSGTSPYTYSWNNGDTAQTLSGIGSGTYAVTVTGQGNCTAAASVVVSSTDAVNLIASFTDESCNTGNGSASVMATSGASPYIYLWNNGEDTAAISNLSSAIYSVTVTSLDGCTASTAVTVTSTAVVTLSATSQNTTCGNNNGTATASPATGSPPFTYVWSNGDTTAVVFSLAAGTYNITATDAYGCSATASAVVTASNGIAVTITTGKTIMCSGDSTNICAPAGFASYLWNTAQSDSCIKARLAGNYYVTVTDNTGCSAESNHLAINVYPLPPVAISVNGDTLTVYGAVTQQWHLNGSAINGATHNIYIASQGGSYTVAVTDTNGCIATSSPVIISGIDNLTEEDAVSIYPNPSVDGSWALEVGSNLIGGTVEVFDANGRVVFHSLITNHQSLITPEIARGVYLLHISSERSNAVRKLIRL